MSSAKWWPFHLGFIHALRLRELMVLMKLIASNINGRLRTWGYFTNVSRALPNFPSKFVYGRNRTADNFQLKLFTRAQAMASNTLKKFQLEILIINHHKCDFWQCIFSRDYFGENPQNNLFTNEVTQNDISVQSKMHHIMHISCLVTCVR